MQKRIVSTLLAAVLWMISAIAAPHADNLNAYSSALNEHDKVLSVISDRITSYHQSYPGIYFLHLEGGRHAYLDLVRLTRLLGSDPQPLDYEHTRDLREDLLDVTMQRMKLMLNSNNISATLFRVGQESTLDSEYLCVITLNPDDFGTSGYVDMENILNLPATTISRIHPSRRLDNFDYLQFVLNHEMYHCVDSYLNGGQRMSKDDYIAEYDLLKRESVADAYAMSVHVKNHDGLTTFARNFLHMRALWIYSNSPHHCTFETIKTVLKREKEVLKSKDDLATFVKKLTTEVIGNYSNYISNHAAALNAARMTGANIEKYGKRWVLLADQQKNQNLEDLYFRQFRYYYQMLFNDERIKLDLD